MNQPSVLVCLATLLGAADTHVDLVSPAACALQASGRMSRCRIPTRDLSGTAFETAVPLRTVLKSTSAGICSTWYPLSLSLASAGEPAVVLPINAPTQAVLRRRDGGVMTLITLSDASRWTTFADLDPSCRIGLDIVWNEPDVSSRAEAEAIIARLQNDLQEKTKVMDRYQALVLYQSAFTLMNQVATNFWATLTNPTMQELREKARATKPTLFNMIAYCQIQGPPDDPSTPPPLSDEDRMNLLDFYSAMSALGSPEAFRKADGEMMSLGEYLGEDANAVLNTVQKLAAIQGADATADYRAAAEAVSRAGFTLSRAREQLAAWLAS